MRKLLCYALVACLFTAGVSFPSLAVNRGDYQLKESKSRQVIHTNTWANLSFAGSDSLKRKKNYRTLFCAKVHIVMPKKDSSNPTYLKLRFARHLPNGTLDTTGTNTWVIGKNFTGATFHASVCWTMDTKYSVTAQVKLVGGASSYVSNLRQFKAWSPPYELPADMVTPAPNK